MTAPIDPAMAHCGQCAHRLGSGCGCGCCAWAGEAVRAAAEVIHTKFIFATRRAEILAREAVQAALPVIAAAVAAAERERIIALAIDHDAIYTTCENPGCPGKHERPFADLLRAPGA